MIRGKYGPILSKLMDSARCDVSTCRTKDEVLERTKRHFDDLFVTASAEFLADAAAAGMPMKAAIRIVDRESLEYRSKVFPRIHAMMTEFVDRHMQGRT